MQALVGLLHYAAQPLVLDRQLSPHKTDESAQMAMEGVAPESAPLFSELYRTNLSEDLSQLWHPASPEDVLTVFVEVGKTGSTTIKAAILDAVASKEKSYCVIDLRERRLDKGEDPRVCSGSAMVFGATFGSCAAVSSGHRCQYLTSLREPGNRTVSEYNYFCRACAERSGARLTSSVS